MKMEHEFRVFDYNVYNAPDPMRDTGEYKDSNSFMVQMVGVDEAGRTYSVVVEGFKPFFYVLVNDQWTIAMKEKFVAHLKEKMGKFYVDSITDSKIIKRKKLYGFDDKKEHKFIYLEFANLNAFNKAKNLWYTDYQSGHTLVKTGYSYLDTDIMLYEANIPPLLRFFHVKEISPSGWVSVPKKKVVERTGEAKTVNCDYEFVTNIKNITALNDKEARVPYKIMSFDIEASSSHGDFPVPIKTYKKLATNIVEYFENVGIDHFTQQTLPAMLERIVLAAFGYGEVDGIDLVYPKKAPASRDSVFELIRKWLDTHVRSLKKSDEFDVANTIESAFDRIAKEFAAQSEDKDNEDNDDSDNEPEGAAGVAVSYGKKYVKEYSDKKATIVDILLDKKYEREGKLNELNVSLNSIFPKLEGDKVTFIGSTFMNYGNKDPHFNHCIVLNTCAGIPLENSALESYATEQEVLLAWQRLVQRENPDIVIGYNIFGFDYEFMFRRAEENNCVEDFLQLSRNKGEVCATRDKDTGKFKIEESTIQIASGQHDLRFIKMNGRLQVDLYNFYRRTENLNSYKLDYVAGNFIGDFVKKLDHHTDGQHSIVTTTNLTGLLVGSYVHLEEIGHTVDYYDDGAKYLVTSIDKMAHTFELNAVVSPDFAKKVRWCLAKDDVTPKDIFRLTNGTQEDRAIIAKYCIQDCNLVHYLFNKSDVLTGFIEMAKICSVPINFLVMRGQGIKLQSLIANECRQIRTLIPVIEKGDVDEGYEGAIVLPPKCDLYLDNPVACVDYASLYPSSMISENLSHDSKVWTREYDLAGNLIEECGEKNDLGEYMYDNLPWYEYVDVEYDTYRYFRKHPKAAAEKIKCGHKVCRFAQFPDGESAIMPAILKKLLKARKDTRKMIPNQTDEFMKQVLEQRQLGYKVTANSLYGGCGAKTSTFYEKDIAACTTATGRKLLTYAKRVIEDCYGDSLCNTANHGPVLTKAEYIYGDSVANYTPIYLKVEDQIVVLTVDAVADRYGKGLWIASSEPGKQDKEFCELENDVQTWTEKGWTKLFRVIRHPLASHKKMVRVLTHTGCVDVTDDHSLLDLNGKELTPKDCVLGTQLLHHGIIEDCRPMEITIPCAVECDTQLKASYAVRYLQRRNLPYRLDWATTDDNQTTTTTYTVTPIYADNLDDCAIVSMCQIPYEGYVYDLTTENHHFAAGVGNLIVHNTDSVFFTFNLQTPEGQPIRGKDALEITIELAQEAGHLASSFLKGPHDLEYEKTFMPFCLLSKKRYVGMLYETDPNKCKRKEMGIVLKRRDNAPIVKDIYGGIIDILMKKQNIQEAIGFLRSCLQNIVDERYPMEKLVITKSLRSGYKNPKAIAHKVLADRITARDPGNKPSSGDRIAFAYISVPGKKVLQGEKIETPAFILENNLKIDYSFYITNQIMKPVQQLFALVIEKIWEMQNKRPKLLKYRKEVEQLRKELDAKYEGEELREKIEEKIEQLRCKEVKAMLFDEYLRETNNEKAGVQSLTKFFPKK
jgi:DNA polymerase elongation subunit (family B)